MSARLLAVLSAFNEADVLEHVIAALVHEGAEVHVVDNWSTDGSYELAQRRLGQGVVAVERFPADGPQETYAWSAILARKSAIAHASGADWVMSTDADEFRESPWAGVRLVDALHRVEAAGCNAVNFRVLDFRPVDDAFVPGTDPREHLLGFEPGRTSDTAQVKLWRRPPQPVPLEVSGGHDADFPGRRVFPVPFVLRHYSIRGETQGRQKVLRDRVPRLRADERERGWHRQYDGLAGGRESFLRDPGDLVPYGDGSAVREELLSTTVEDLLLAMELAGTTSQPDALDPSAVARWLERHGGPGDPAAAARLQEAAGLVLAHRPEDGVAHAEGLEAELVAWLGAMARVCRARGQVLLSQRCLQWQDILAVGRVERDPAADDAELGKVLGPVRGAVTATLATELLRAPGLLERWLDGGAADRTLVVAAAPDELDRLVAALQGVDVGEADVVVADVPLELWPALARRAEAYLGTMPPPAFAAAARRG